MVPLTHSFQCSVRLCLNLKFGWHLCLNMTWKDIKRKKKRHIYAFFSFSLPLSTLFFFLVLFVRFVQCSCEHGSVVAERERNRTNRQNYFTVVDKTKKKENHVVKHNFTYNCLYRVVVHEWFIQMNDSSELIIWEIELKHITWLTDLLIFEISASVHPLRFSVPPKMHDKTLLN